MRLFRKKHDVEQKLVEPHQQSTWLVWTLSIVTFFLTVAIVLGLFWAGRWVVHRFTKKPAPTTAPTTITNTREQSSSGSGSASSGNAGSTGNTGNTGTPTPPANTSPTTPAPAQNNPAPAATAPTNLVNTGPSSDE